MKKIIAAAVATAFVAPAFAADVAVSGFFEHSFVSTKTDGAMGQDLEASEAYFVIKADSELANGMSAGADYSIRTDGNHWSGASVYVAGSFGKLELGDTSGAIDTIDDKADVFHMYDNGSGTTTNDADLNWSLPALADGLKVNVAYSPEESGEDDASAYGIDQHNDGGGAAGSTGISLSYAVMDGLTVGFGRDQLSSAEQETENTLYNLVYSLNGIRIAYEKAESSNDTDTTTATQETEQTSMAVSYSMNDVTVHFGTNKTEDIDAGTTDSDVTAFGIEYSLGDLVLFAEQAEDDEGNKDELTAVGVAYKF